MSAINLIYKMQNAQNHHIKTLYRKILRLVYSCEVTPSCKFGRNIEMSHNGLGCVIWATEIGDNTTIWQNVTLGSGKGQYPDVFPKIGKNCKIYTGAVVIGNITIGDGAIIGANAVVTHDVPENTVVAGVPARIIRHIDKD